MNSEKISITAEFVSIIRSEKDPRNLFFVSDKARKIYNFLKKVISEKRIKEIFNQRLLVSDDFDKKVSTGDYEQIIELAAGYSLRGFNLCLKDKKVVYIDSDFEDVIQRKKEILKNICEKESIIFPTNYFLVTINALKDDIFQKIQRLASKDKKTIIMAEGLTSYFSEAEFDGFIENIKKLLSNFTDGEFFSHESVSRPAKRAIYWLLRKMFISRLTKTKSRHVFETTEELEKYLGNKNVDRFKGYLDEHKHLLYSIYS